MFMDIFNIAMFFTRSDGLSGIPPGGAGRYEQNGCRALRPRLEIIADAYFLMHLRIEAVCGRDAAFKPI